MLNQDIVLCYIRSVNKISIHKTSNIEAMPIIKWAGGKSKVVDTILDEIGNSKYDTWIDLFAGSLALPLALKPKKLVINDINATLIELYKEIAKDPSNLIEKLKELDKDNYNNENQYYDLRDRFNELKESEYTTECGALFIYLNKRSFNGLYRENKKGEFNVPYRKYEGSIFDIDNIIALHRFFNEREVRFYHGNYREFSDSYFKKGDLVYIDPPYYPISDSSFTSYHSSGFGVIEQEELREFIGRLDIQGIKFIMSNSPCKAIDELYSRFNIFKYELKRSMRSAKGVSTSGNGENECLVHNLGLDHDDLSKKHDISTMYSDIDEIEETIRLLRMRKRRIKERIYIIKGESKDTHHYE